jgi:branched-chain amino acid transport system substrate-binding protein
MKGGIKMEENKTKKDGMGMDRRAFLKTATILGTTMTIGGLPRLAHAQAKKTIKIGAIAPLSGYNASVGQHMKNAYELAIGEINAAGGVKSLGGARIELLTGDDEGKPESGMAEAERLIRAGVVMLTGSEASQVSFATTEVAEKNKICHIVPISTSDNITERGFKYTFRTTDRTASQGPRIMRFVKALEVQSGIDLKTAVMLHVDNMYGKFQAETVKKAAKDTGIIEILADFAYPSNVRDLSSEITKAKSYKPDLLMACSFVQDSILITNTMFEQRFEVKGVLGLGSHHHLPEYLQAVGKKGEYVMIATSYVNHVGKKATDLAAKYLSKYGKIITYHAAAAYETGYFIADVLERAGSTDSEKIRDALTRSNYFSEWQTREGTIYFDETGQCPSNLRALIQIIGGRHYVVDPPQFAERPPVFPIPK